MSEAKPKRVMTPEQLEKLSQARVKALAVKKAMKEKNDAEKIDVLQAKMEKIRTKTKKETDREALLAASKNKEEKKSEPPPSPPSPPADDLVLKEEVLKEELPAESEPEAEEEEQPTPKPAKVKSQRKKPSRRKPVVILEDLF